MKIKKLIQLIILSFLLNSCGSGLKDALQGKKRSDNSDEFLIEKKNPLTVPPDINELPEPLDQEDQKDNEDINIKKVLKIDENKNTDSENNDEKQNNLEKLILEKIND